MTQRLRLYPWPFCLSPYAAAGRLSIFSPSVRLGVGGRRVADRFEQAAVEPADRFEGGVFDRIGLAAWIAPPTDLGFQEAAARGLGERIVIAIADAADGGFDP